MIHLESSESKNAAAGAMLGCGLPGAEPWGKRGQSSLFEQERQRRLPIPVDCRIREELRMNVPLQRQRRRLR
jgi:hypothetical protein